MTLIIACGLLFCCFYITHTNSQLVSLCLHSNGTMLIFGTYSLAMSVVFFPSRLIAVVSSHCHRHCHLVTVICIRLSSKSGHCQRMPTVKQSRLFGPMHWLGLSMCCENIAIQSRLLLKDIWLVSTTTHV